MSITKIVLTGGPCAGKSTAKSWILDEYTKRGYLVFFIDEIVTSIKESGISPSLFDNMIDFEKVVYKIQKERENAFEEVAKQLNKKTLLVCDRGILDIKGYLNQQEFEELLQFYDSNEIIERDSYDAVFHLVTAANGAPEAYTLDNNPARQEKTLEEAIEKDISVINAWTGHPHLRVIDNSTGFEEKMKRLIQEISSVLGEPKPFEIERKFLIQYPDINMLNELPNCNKVSIVQTYLVPKTEGWERRIRQRGDNGNYTYSLTEKLLVTDVTRIEKERRISQDEYLKFMMEADINAHPIRKDRYCLTENNQYFEIDIYPNWTDKAVMEIELKNEDEPIHFPSCVNIIREITDEKEYSNYFIAHQ